MKILAYDTSGEILNTVLLDGAKEAASFTASGFLRHSSSLMPGIEAVLKKAGWKAKDIQAVAVGLGPGSFTGIRVGVTAAKTLSYALNVKLIGVPGLEAMAYAAKDKKNIPVATLLDARRGLLYAAQYQFSEKGLKVVRAPFLGDAAKVMKVLKGGIAVAEERIPDELLAGKGFKEVIRLNGPGADLIAEAARKRVTDKRFDDAFRLEPLYLHPRDCNVTLPGKKRKAAAS